MACPVSRTWTIFPIMDIRTPQDTWTVMDTWTKLDNLMNEQSLNIQTKAIIMEEKIKITSILQALTKAVAETFHLSTLEAISAVAMSKTAARITSNRNVEYSIESEIESLLSELRMGKS